MPPKTVSIPIEQVARLDHQSALGITRSDPGDNLDLTRHTPIWAWVRWGPSDQTESICIRGGEGIGRSLGTHATRSQDSDEFNEFNEFNNHPAIYQYAQRLLRSNLSHWLPPGKTIDVMIVLPEGRSLALRTSNAAFGVVDGLSLLGTSGIAQPLSAPSQLEQFRVTLRQRLIDCPGLTQQLVFCIGENGLDLARHQGISEQKLIKTANWIGPLLVEAALQHVQSIHLFGYHGKLIKLAGGIFHTHHHLADGRLDILTAQCAVLGLPQANLNNLFKSETTDKALQYLRQLDQQTESQWESKVYEAIAYRINQRTQDYIYRHSEKRVMISTTLFGRDRQIIVQTKP